MFNLTIYIDLIRSFLSGKIDASFFESEYLRIFKSETESMPDNIFFILDELFADVDDYCGDPTLIDIYDIDEKELRKRCQIALEKLLSCNQ